LVAFLAIIAACVAWALAARRAPGGAWAVGALVIIGVAYGVAVLGPGSAGFLAIAVAAISCAMLLPPLRRTLVSDRLLVWFRKVLPPVSATEREALDAGTVWWDGDLFGGRPDWQRLLAFPKPTLSSDEQAFLDGPVNELCGMLDDWEVTYERNDLPPEAWQFIKDRGFMGMIIPREYGGLGFSALAHSEVVSRLATRSPTATVTVMVPNSLGPAELLLHYGTDEQKRHYLPRLAKGLDVPCFALTGPEAGSDAGSIPDVGIVCRGMHEGRELLGMRVTWEKRYITLGPVATLLGLAFRLRDPDRLLGGETDVGITLALIPTSHPGVEIGRRHFPLNGSFMNGPNSGRDVFIPMDWVIGGPARVGQGWRMLMECLAAGRSISLPSSCAGMAKLAARTTGAYGRIRTQFRTPVARFEGVDEALARIVGNTYLIEAARVMTAGAVDLGEKPSVISAIVKYHLTERGRAVINDAMDIHGGKGICLGPNNYLGRAYQQAPIGITVEGANILTRSMIVFGQGAIRCHPFVLREIAATRDSDPARASRMFDAALWGHVRFLLGNFASALWHGITGSRFAAAPAGNPMAAHYRELARLSAVFAFAADIAMLVIGGALKRREKLSARLGDVLSQLYLASCVLKRYADDGHPEADAPIVRWCVEDAVHRAEEALQGLAQNFPGRLPRALIWLAAFPLGRRRAPPDDRLGSAVARLATEISATRDRLTRGMYLPIREDDPVGRLEVALATVPMAEALEVRLRAAIREGRLAADAPDRLDAAVRAGVMTPDEGGALARHRRVVRDCIMVDDFPHDVGRAAMPRQAAESATIPRVQRIA
jgi:acyl-CoA dehydrogenase